MVRSPTKRPRAVPGAGTQAVDILDPGGLPAVVVHSVTQAAAALAMAGPAGVLLLSAPGAAGSLGAAWFLGIIGQAAACQAAPPPPHLAVIDCATEPGYALVALRAGLRALVLDPGCPGFAAVERAAATLGAQVLPARPAALDLAGLDLRRPGGRARLAAWLAGTPQVEDG